MNSSTLETKPYSDQETKKTQVRRMFDNIASNYDLLNRLLSFGVDRYWRRVLVRRLKKQRSAALGSDFKILDLATGTADLPIMIASKFGEKMQGVSIAGVDLSDQMLSFGQVKLDKLKAKRPLAANISLAQGDAEQLSFDDEVFDAVTAVFGVRNFGDKARGLAQMYRVLKGGSKIYILEFGTPDNKLIGGLYRFYFHRLLPAVGGLISRDFKAYDYLPRSVDTFPSKGEFCEMMTSAGFESVGVRSMTFGVANLYYGDKK